MKTANREEMQKREKEFIDASGIKCPKCGKNNIEVLYGWVGSYYDLRCESCGNNWTVHCNRNKGWTIRK